MTTSLVTRAQSLSHVAALELLAKEWSTAHSVAIADVVDALDAQLAQPAFSGDTKSWLTAAKSANVEVRGPLLRAIKGHTGDDTVKMLRVAVGWNDPRLTHALRELLTRLPWAGARSRSVWRDVFDVLQRHGDPRWLAIAQTLPSSWNVGKPLQVWLTRHLQEAIAHFTLAPVDDETAFAAWAAELRATAPKAAPTPESGEALLAAIYKNPDDDTARVVYADWLLEREDPRGEFIALQFKNDAASTRRANQLLKVHKKEWLGPLANAIRGEVEFRRGFPSKAVVTFRHQRDAEEWGSLVEWATLEEIEYSHTIVRDDQVKWSHFISPAMCALRVAHRPTVEHLLATDKPWRLELLAIDEKPTPAMLSAFAGPLFPHLRTLQISNWRCEPACLDGVVKCPPHLLVSESLDDAKVEAWLAAARKTEAVTFTMRQWGEIDHVFSRDESGAFTRLEAVVRPKPPIKELTKKAPSIEVLVKALRAAKPKVKWTHLRIRVEVDGALVDATHILG